MAYQRQIPWAGLHEYLIKVGAERRIENLLQQSVKELQRFVPFESAIVFVANQNGSFLHILPFNITSKLISDYFIYYKNFHTSEYGIPAATPIVSYSKTISGKRVQETDFFHDFLKPNQLQNMTGVQLHYNARTPLAQLMLFRSQMFTPEENNILALLQPHLSNLSANLLTSRSENYVPLINEKLQTLTAREREIICLLHRGLSPKKIGIALQISTYTVYKHINHILEKLNVADRYELIVQFAGMSIDT
jgi:DNA-binding CsgD family transcriptional regulator